jgi:hypothetical protein
MRIHWAAALLVTSASCASAACDIDAISTALESSLAHMKPAEIDVSKVESTDGGVWRVYREADGRMHSITRSDYGESGRREMRLSTVSRGAYGISETRIDYLRHAYLEEAGPNGMAKRTTTFYYFCDGKLYVPAPEAAMLDTEAYPKAGAAALAEMRDDADIAKFTIGLKK